MNKEKIESINRAITLKKLEEEKKINEKQAQELQKWLLENAALARLSSAQLQEELDKLTETQEVSIKSDNISDIIADYKKQFGDKDWYEEPKVEDGKVTLRFQTMEELTDFLQGQAQKNRKFVVIDAATNQVMAYSNGDGTLYHGNGKPFAKGDTLASCGPDAGKFKTPPQGLDAQMTSMQGAQDMRTAVSQTRASAFEAPGKEVGQPINLDEAPAHSQSLQQ